MIYEVNGISKTITIKSGFYKVEEFFGAIENIRKNYPDYQIYIKFDTVSYPYFPITYPNYPTYPSYPSYPTIIY